MAQPQEMRNKLAISPLTDKIYWIDGKGEKHEVEEANFVHVCAMKFGTDDTMTMAEGCWETEVVTAGHKVCFHVEIEKLPTT